MKKTIGFLLKTFLPLGIGVYLFWYFFSSMDKNSLNEFYKAFREANYFWIFLSLILSFIALLARAKRWEYVLEPMGHKSAFWNRYHSIMIGYLVNLTIPRAGEASRAVFLYRSDNVPFAKSFGTIVAERAVDLVMLATIGFIALTAGAEDFDLIWNEMLARFGAKPGEEGGFPFKLVILSVAALGVAFLTYKYFKDVVFKGKIIEFVKGLIAGVFSIFKSTNPIGYVLLTITIWSCYLLMFGICFMAIEPTSDFPIKGMLIGFIAGSIGITFTNGGIGTYPLLVGLVIAFYLKEDYGDSAQGIGNALGMVIWISQTVMMILLGLLSLILIPKNFLKKNVETSEDTIEDRQS
jgi:uncharacterized membrane protein YbhN (UPF0104 family)